MAGVVKGEPHSQLPGRGLRQPDGLVRLDQVAMCPPPTAQEAEVMGELVRGVGELAGFWAW